MQASDNPYHVLRSQAQPSVLIGGPTPRPLNSAGVNDSGRIEVTVTKLVVYPMFATNKYANRTQIQAASNVTVSITVSDPDLVAQDIATANAGGTTFLALWTTVTLTNGYAQIEGSLSGVMFNLASGTTGRATIVKQ
jgi:hypothetical protein